MDKAKIKRLKQFYETPEERRKFLKYLKSVGDYQEESKLYRYGPLLNKYAKAVIDRHMPDVKKASKEINLLQRVYSNYERVTNTQNLNNNTHIFYQVRDLTLLKRKLRKLHAVAKKRGIRITKNVNACTKRKRNSNKSFDKLLRLFIHSRRMERIIFDLFPNLSKK
jgi:hypothetical protein